MANLMDPKDRMKAVRQAGRQGQQVLRRRGGYHEPRGYKRPQQARWEDR